MAEITKRKLTEVAKLDPLNANAHTERGMNLLEKSMTKFGPRDAVTIDKNGFVVDGNARTETYVSMGVDEVQVITGLDPSLPVYIQYADLDLEDEGNIARELSVALNQIGRINLNFDPEMLQLYTEGGIDLTDFFLPHEAEQMNVPGLGGTLPLPTEKQSPERPKKYVPELSMTERFGVPPFTVLDSRAGYWRDRIRVWKAKGIDSGAGRGSELTYAETSQPGAYMDVKNDLIRRGLPYGHDEIVAEAKRVGLYLYNDGEGQTSIFDPVLTELVYRWFNPTGGKILDPFAGGSVRGIVAAMLGYPYVGIDIREEQVAANRANAALVLSDDTLHIPAWIVGDSKDLVALVGDYEADLLFSCPPYGNLEVYSDDPNDISNMTYPAFLEMYRLIIAESCKKLRDGRFAVFVVGDYRDKKGYYMNFVSDTISAFHDAGLHLYNEAIYVTPVGSLAIRAGKPFVASRKLGKSHQNVLVFIKGSVDEVRDWDVPNFSLDEANEEELYGEEL